MVTTDVCLIFSLWGAFQPGKTNETENEIQPAVK